MSADELFAKDDSNLKAQVDRMIHFNVVSYFSKIMREGGGGRSVVLSINLCSRHKGPTCQNLGK